MPAPGTRVIVRKPSNRRAEDPTTGKALWWLSPEMDHLDGTEQEVEKQVRNTPWLMIKGSGWMFADSWMEVVSTLGTDVASANTPKNNDGRSACFWCHVPTAKRGGGLYDVCPKCGR